MHRKPLMIDSPILNLGVKSESLIGQTCGTDSRMIWSDSSNLPDPDKSPSPQLSRAESPNEPRLLPGSVVYFFLGAALAAEACCCFF